MRHIHPAHRRNATRPARRGAAVVELAICLPVLLLIALGSIESANAIYLKQTLTSIAYEGARLATSPGGTTNSAESLCEQLLETRGVADFEIDVSRITPATTSGTPITVRVSAPVSNNSVGITRFFTSALMTSEVTMPRL